MLLIFANGIFAVKRNAVTLFYSCEKWNRVCSYVSVKAYVSIKAVRNNSHGKAVLATYSPYRCNFRNYSATELIFNLAVHRRPGVHHFHYRRRSKQLDLLCGIFFTRSPLDGWLCESVMQLQVYTESGAFDCN